MPPKSIGTSIRIVGAREHNLRNVSLEIPRNALVVMTGVSGSGKSSLAFDTIYAEGQRRYVESLSSYARQFLQLARKPDVDSLEGLSPAIAIEQKTTSRNPRSTVGTVTEIHDYLRLLFARCGVPHSPATGEPIESQTIPQMTKRLLALPAQTRVVVLAPIARGRKGEFASVFRELTKKGFARVKVDGTIYHPIEDVPKLDKNRNHDIAVVVDRLAMRPEARARVAESLETAVGLTDGLALAEIVSGEREGETILFSTRFACPVSGFTIPEMEPRLFSFNSPHGACPDCDGIGSRPFPDPDRIVPDDTLSLLDGAITALPSPRTSAYARELCLAAAKIYAFDPETPWRAIPAEAREAILHGNDRSDGALPQRRRRRRGKRAPFDGILPALERRWRAAAQGDTALRDELERFFSYAQCPTCNGHRLKPEARAVKLNTLHIGETARMTIAEARKWFAALPKAMTRRQREIGHLALLEITRRLEFLEDVGLDYLTLARGSATLSGGEAQRIRLASQIGAGLTGVLYALDEPSIGLHQRDNRRLLDALGRLRDLGNTVIVVEHDEDAIRAADHIVDIGPGAGEHGGHIVAQGNTQAILNEATSITGDYLAGRRSIAIPKRRKINPKHRILIKGAQGNNLTNLNVAIPLGVLTCITGVSGSGKSTLINDTLHRALARKVMRANAAPPAKHTSIDGFDELKKIIAIDQSPIGRTPRSNPATYSGAFTPMREWFAALPEARARGWKPGRFSFNVVGGRCETCQGDGSQRIAMHFLPDVHVVCEACQGKRYRADTMDITHRGVSIADALAMSVEQAAAFFVNIPPIRKRLEGLTRAGIGYVKLGQPATTLSGGEAQRVKLARELARGEGANDTLYIFDEPTTGLHFHDVAHLLEALHSLVDAGATVVVIEHNLDVIKTADHVIDLGPEGGAGGGRIVAQGTPEAVAKVKTSYTGQFLHELFTKATSGKRQAKPKRKKTSSRNATKPAPRKSGKRLGD